MMRERLERTWVRGVHHARSWQREDDPTPVLEAVAWAVVLRLIDGLKDRPEEERDVLLRRGVTACSAARALAMSEPRERDEWLACVSLANAGLSALRGEDPAWTDLESDLVRPSPQRVVRMLHGDLDGFSAARCAVHCYLHGRAEVGVLAALADGLVPEPEKVLLAAADPAPMMSPQQGRVVGAHEGAGLEAVLFERPRRLAVYAATEVFVRGIAIGVTTEDVQPGYWLGSLESSLEGKVELTVQVGEQTVAFPIDLG